MSRWQGTLIFGESQNRHVKSKLRDINSFFHQKIRQPVRQKELHFKNYYEVVACRLNHHKRCSKLSNNQIILQVPRINILSKPKFFQIYLFY